MAERYDPIKVMGGFLENAEGGTQASPFIVPPEIVLDVLTEEVRLSDVFINFVEKEISLADSVEARINLEKELTSLKSRRLEKVVRIGRIQDMLQHIRYRAAELGISLEDMSQEGI